MLFASVLPENTGFTVGVNPGLELGESYSVDFFNGRGIAANSGLKIPGLADY